MTEQLGCGQEVAGFRRACFADEDATGSAVVSLPAPQGYASPISATLNIEVVGRQPATVADVVRFRRCAEVLREWVNAVDLNKGPLDQRVIDLITDFREHRVSMSREDRDPLSTWLRDWLHREGGRRSRGVGRASKLAIRVTRLARGVAIPGAGHVAHATPELLAFIAKLLADRPANRYAQRPQQPVVLDVARKTSGGVWKPVDFTALVLDQTVEGLKKGANWPSWA